MKRKFILTLSCMMLTVFGTATVSLAETTKEKWVKQKKAKADKEASESYGSGGNNAGEARQHNAQVEEKRKAKHKEIDETAKRLGDGKKR